MRSFLSVASLFFLAPSAVGGPLPSALFDQATQDYHEGHEKRALSEFLGYLSEEPNGPHSEDAIKRIWDITQKIKTTEQTLNLDPQRWRRAVERAHNDIAHRKAATEILLSDLQNLDEALTGGKAPLAALRSAAPAPSMAKLAQLDDVSRGLAERHLADIRTRLGDLAKGGALDTSDLHELRGYFWFYQGDLELAIGEWKQAHELRPNDHQLQQQLESASNTWRVQKERDEIQYELAIAETDFKAGRLKQAKSHNEVVLGLEPGNGEGIRQAQRIDAAISETSKEERIALLLAAGRDHEHAGKLLDAVQNWIDVLILDSGNAEARNKLERVRRRLAFTTVNAAVRRPSPPTLVETSPISTEDQSIAQQTYYLALIEYTDGNLEQAKTLFTKAFSYDHNLEKAKKGLEQVEAELRNR